MSWLLRRLLLPFILGSIVCTTLLLVWELPGSEIPQMLGSPAELWFVAVFPVLFQVIGLAVVVPAARILRQFSLRTSVSAVVLTVLGSAIWVLVALPIDERLTLPEFAALGAVSALIWLALNRDAVVADEYIDGGNQALG